jgi:hypothetical protein
VALIDEAKLRFGFAARDPLHERFVGHYAEQGTSTVSVSLMNDIKQ